MEVREPPLDGEALERLYVRLERPLFNVVYRMLWKAEDSQEVVQETFVRLFRMRERVRMSSVEPLAYRIALNLANSRLRSRRLWRWVSLGAQWDRASPDPNAEDLLAAAQDGERLRSAIEGLSPDLRNVILLCELSDLGYDRVAEALGIPPGTVGSRRHRAIEQLRDALGQERNHG
jgi:RNA polymerase sigma factor (sigma-70 family)